MPSATLFISRSNRAALCSHVLKKESMQDKSVYLQYYTAYRLKTMVLGMPTFLFIEWHSSNTQRVYL